MANSTYIYHITHINNLPAIIQRGALCCQTTTDHEQLSHVVIGDQGLKDRRSRRHVPIGPGGVLSDYAPWYFAPRSPMLFVINKRHVPGYNGGQNPIVHLVTSAERVRDAGIPFVFTDGHAYVQFSEFYIDLSDLNKVDFQLMREKYWNDTQADNDRERRRSAEFLIHHEAPWPLIGAIGVISQAVADEVAKLLPAHETTPPIIVRPDWYY